MALDLDKLEKQLDDQLAKETPETLRAYFTGNKPDYKSIVSKAIGEKPSLVKPNYGESDIEGAKGYIKATRKIFDDYPTTTEPYKYKQQGFLPFANPPRFTEE
jgi:hypothetical protein